MKTNDHATSRTRRRTVFALLGLAAGSLMWRAVDLHVVDKGFLRDQGDARHLRVVAIPAHRGMITDRNGEPLAVSTPVDSVGANPTDLLEARAAWPPLARLLNLDLKALRKYLEQRANREFVYLKRGLSPEVARQVMALEVPGVSLRREYRRYYPEGEVTAHLVGFTANADDHGQEGMERVYNATLRGTEGAKRVIKDNIGRSVENVEGLSDALPGKNVALSIDRRIQYLAYRELKAAIQAHHAQSGSLVMLDARSGEVLAMVNQPSYNPNNRGEMSNELYRNRAVTDLFEPGSTVKPFTIAAALEAGTIRPETRIDTSPGQIMLGHFTVRDTHSLGLIDITTVIQKSSNIGAAKIALGMPAEKLWSMFSRVGLGSASGTGFPGETNGVLVGYRRWTEIDRATHAYGYGLSVTPLQLTRAYSMLADDGRVKPVSFVRRDTPVTATQAVAPEIVAQVRRMLETVTEEGGTGTAARVAGYRVGGKTGTVHKIEGRGYAEHRYLAVFAGMAPITKPRLVMAVMINEPTTGEYYGGQVAAPVFGRVMAGALRLLDIPPDDLPSLQMQVVHAPSVARGRVL